MPVHLGEGTEYIGVQLEHLLIPLSVVLKDQLKNYYIIQP